VRAGQAQHLAEEVSEKQARLDVGDPLFLVHRDRYPPLFHAVLLDVGIA